MIKDFNIVKKQLLELSEIVNSFNSESVQLRVIDLLFQRIGIETTDQGSKAVDDNYDKTKNQIPQKKRKIKSDEKEKSKSTRTAKGGRPGPGAIIKQLIDDGFFDKPNTIQNIIDHCRSKFAYSYKSNEIAMALTRALRNELIMRQKNAEKQFEYIAK